MALDVLSLIGIVLTTITCISYYRIVSAQFKYIKKEPVATRMAILSLRAALIIPGFAICYLVSLAFPTIYVGMQLPEAYLQGYSVFCFFGLIAYYVGGPEQCVEIFKTSSHTFPACLFGYMHKKPRKYYYHSYIFVWQFVFIRPMIVVLIIIAYYIDQNNLSLIISALATIMAAVGVGSLVKFYHVLYDYCKGLNMTKKILIVKTIIGLVLFQGFMEDVLFYFGFLNFSGGLKSFSAADKAIRLYCFAVLVELVLFCVLVEHAFARDFKYARGKNFSAGLASLNGDGASNDIEERASRASDDMSVSLNRDTSSSLGSFAYPSMSSAATESTSTSISNGPSTPGVHPDAFVSNENLTFWAFLFQLCNVLDIFLPVRMTHAESNLDSSMSTPQEPTTPPGSHSSATNRSTRMDASIKGKPRLSEMVDDSPPQSSIGRDTQLVDMKPSVTRA